MWLILVAVTMEKVTTCSAEPEYIDGTYKIDDGKDGEKSIEETVKYLRKYWNLSGGIDGEEI